MRIIIQPSARAAAAEAAGLIAAALDLKPDLVIALPTGRTAVPMYRALAALHRAGRASFRDATSFNLDEFIGIPAAHPGSYRSFMTRHLFRHVDLSADRTYVLNGLARRPRDAAAAFEAAIETAGGLDVAVVGLGANGHIGFNEPGPALSARTHVVKLHASTRRANAALFGGDWRRVPTSALSMGMATILGARRIVLLATGRHKAAIVTRALSGPITTRVPGSLLQTHPNCVVVLDRDAARGLAARISRA
jgi:glucosamine-6-phosphate deaminase